MCCTIAGIGADNARAARLGHGHADFLLGRHGLLTSSMHPRAPSASKSLASNYAEYFPISAFSPGARSASEQSSTSATPSTYPSTVVYCRHGGKYHYSYRERLIITRKEFQRRAASPDKIPRFVPLAFHFAPPTYSSLFAWSLIRKCVSFEWNSKYHTVEVYYCFLCLLKKRWYIEITTATFYKRKIQDGRCGNAIL